MIIIEIPLVWIQDIRKLTPTNILATFLIAYGLASCLFIAFADTVAAEVLQRHPSVRVRRLTAPDSYVPLGAAANLVLVQEDDIERELRALLEDA